MILPDWISEDGRIVLYNHDCREVLPELETASIDGFVLDPPFGIGFVYDDGKEVADNPTDYAAWLLPIIGECKRVARPGALFAVWQAALNFKHFWSWFGDDIHIYAAAKNFVQLRKTPINYGFDPVVMWYEPGEPLLPQAQKRGVDFFVANTAAIVSDMTRIEKEHPCPRPLDAVVEIVENFTLPGGLVLDPFAGSGTTALAAMRTGRRFVGMESHRPYFNLAVRRITTTYHQPALPLFTYAG